MNVADKLATRGQKAAPLCLGLIVAALAISGLFVLLRRLAIKAPPCADAKEEAEESEHDEHDVRPKRQTRRGRGVLRRRMQALPDPPRGDPNHVGTFGGASIPETASELFYPERAEGLN